MKPSSPPPVVTRGFRMPPSGRFTPNPSSSVLRDRASVLERSALSGTLVPNRMSDPGLDRERASPLTPGTPRGRSVTLGLAVGLSLGRWGLVIVPTGRELIGGLAGALQRRPVSIAHRVGRRRVKDVASAANRAFVVRHARPDTVRRPWLKPDSGTSHRAFSWGTEKSRVDFAPARLPVPSSTAVVPGECPTEKKSRRIPTCAEHDTRCFARSRHPRCRPCRRYDR